MKYISGFLLVLAAIVLVLLVGTVGQMYQFLKAFHKAKVWIETPLTINNNNRVLATGLDILGNYMCPSLFNDTWITPDARVKFGTKGYTVSEVLGYAQADGKLSARGQWLVDRLNSIEKNHCLVAIGLSEEDILLLLLGKG